MVISTSVVVLYRCHSGFPTSVVSTVVHSASFAVLDFRAADIFLRAVCTLRPAYHGGFRVRTGDPG